MFIIDDIRHQPDAFRQMADACPHTWETAARDLSWVRRVVFTGMGSSYFASVAASYALGRWGLPACAELTSSLLYYGENRLQPGDLLVASSQSGESVEVVKLLQRLAAGGPPVLAVTNRPDSTVARLAGATLPLNVPPDHGVAIKTYGATVLALLWLAMRLTGRPSAAWVKGALDTARAVEVANANAEEWLQMGRDFVQIQSAAVLGRGPSFSAAQAGALLFNEVAKVPAWAEEGGEFRHGVIELAGPGFLGTVLLADGPARGLGVTLVEELANTGARVAAVAPGALAGGLVRTGVTVLPIPDLEEEFLPIVQVVPFQWLSTGWAEARGFEPGRFRHTPGVITSEGKEVIRPGT